MQKERHDILESIAAYCAASPIFQNSKNQTDSGLRIKHKSEHPLGWPALLGPRARSQFRGLSYILLAQQNRQAIADEQECTDANVFMKIKERRLKQLNHFNIAC